MPSIEIILPYIDTDSLDIDLDMSLARIIAFYSEFRFDLEESQNVFNERKKNYDIALIFRHFCT